MSTSEKTFTQVKDIIRKLERSIDEAREKRLHHDEDEVPPVGVSSRSAPSPRSDEPVRAQPMAAPARHDAPRTQAAPGWISR